MPLVQRHARRESGLPWVRYWTPRGVGVDASDDGFLSPRRPSGFLPRNAHLKTLDEMDDTLCILALGDPGLGKSWDLGAYATRIAARIADEPALPTETCGDLLLAFDVKEFDTAASVQSLLFDQLNDAWRTLGGVAYIIIDSLDETPLGVEEVSHAILDGLQTLPLERIRLRIACRTAVLPSILRHELLRRFENLAGEERKALDRRNELAQIGDPPPDGDDVIDKTQRETAPIINPQRKGYAEVEIAILTRGDAIAAAATRLESANRARSFIQEVTEGDVGAFAARPLTLFALIARFAANESLIASQSDLFRSLCYTLVDPSPVKPQHIGSLPVFSREERFHVASRISAAILLGNRSSIALDAFPVLANDVLDISSIAGSERSESTTFRVTEAGLWEAVNTGLFTASTEQSGIVAHLTFAEFMTADWLARRVEPLPQILSLLTDANDVDRRVVPQLRQVAAWLSGFRSDVFDVVALKEPDIILWSDVVQLPAEKRPAIVAALLRGTTENVILNPPFGFRGRLGKLEHAGLAEQLNPVIADKALPARTRELALDIAWSNRAAGVTAMAVRVALDEAEPIDIRALGARVVGEVGNEFQRGMLKPLAKEPPGADVADELKGAALRACWRLFEGAELFRLLARPKRPNWGGTYAMALREISEELPSTYTLDAIAWLSHGPDAGAPYLDRVIQKALKLGLAMIDHPDVLDGLSQYAVRRLRQHRSIFEKGAHHSDETVIAEIEQNVSLRRRWVKGILDRSVGIRAALYELSHGEPPLFTHADVPWAIEELSSLEAEDERRGAWQEAIKWNFVAGPEQVAAVVNARSDPTICELFPHLVVYSSRDEAIGALARQQTKRDRVFARKQRQHRRVLAKREAASKPVKPGSLAMRLRKPLRPGPTGLVRWGPVFAELLRTHANNVGYDFDPQRLEELLALRGKPIAAALVDAAESYLKSAVPSQTPFPNGSTTWDVFFGFTAACVVHELAKDRFEALSKMDWEKWMRSLVGHYVNETERAIHRSILLRATAVAPSVSRRELLRLMHDQAKNNRGGQTDTILDLVFTVPGVERALANRIAKGQYPSYATESLLEELLARESRWAERAGLRLFQTRDSHKKRSSTPAREEETADEIWLGAASAMLSKRPAVIWKELWSHLTTGDDTARHFFSYSARRRDFIEKKALDSLSARQVGDLYELLSRLYPPETDPWHIGVYSPGSRDNLQHLRSSLLSALEARQTEDAVAELERIARENPDRDYLVQVWLRTKATLRSERWSGVKPDEIMRLAERADLRIIESSKQLLDAVTESLARLDAELQGEWRSVVGLWNESSEGSSPKSEEHLSNEIARHLKRDLADRGVAIGRELRIQIQVPGGATGLRTDIDVQAPAIRVDRSAADMPRVIIEVKGSWNPALRTAMRDQLVGQYLDPHRVRAGLYLVGYFTCDSWKRGQQYRKSLSYGPRQELQDWLNDQAKQLSSPIREVRAMVIDTSLPDATSRRSP